jgi:AAA ATPase-like protein
VQRWSTPCLSTTVWRENPYIIGRPIYGRDRFYGREELFDFIRDVLSERAKVILLHGQRRMGKSSVLRQIPIRVPLESEFFFIAFDLQDQARLPLSRVLYNLATAIAERVADMGRGEVTPPPIEKLEEAPQLFTDAFLPQVYSALEGRHVVLLLDEFDVLGNSGAEREDVADTQFFPFLQTVVNRDDKLFLLAVVGRRFGRGPKAALSISPSAPSGDRPARQAERHAANHRANGGNSAIRRR